MNHISLELILHDDVYKLLDGFADLVKIRALFFSADGKAIKCGRDQDNSQYCRLMQDKIFGLDKCLKLDKIMREAAAKSGIIQCYRCHAGLKELIAPVQVQKQTVGFFMFGQYRDNRELPECIRNNREAKKYYEKLPIMTDIEQENLINMLEMLIGYIVEHEFIIFSGHQRTKQLNHFLDNNLSEKITIKQAARHLFCSESTLTHYLRKECDTSFVKLLTEKRLDMAEQLMKKYPEIAIHEVAERTGFRDPHYFSKIYKKIRGYTAKEFKKNNSMTGHGDSAS